MAKCINLTAAEIETWRSEEQVATGEDGIRARMIKRAKALGEKHDQVTVEVYARDKIVLSVSRKSGQWRAVCPQFLTVQRAQS